MKLRRDANGDNSVEEVPCSDLNESSAAEITVDSDLNNGQACIGKLPGVNKGSILADALANEKNRANSTAMTFNSNQTNRDDANGAQPTNTISVHLCSCQQLANEMVTLIYTISSLQSSIFSLETILKDIVLSLLQDLPT